MQAKKGMKSAALLLQSSEEDLTSSDKNGLAINWLEI
jgi:hypothetical protein